MLRLDKVIKPWRGSAALNDHINLYGFWNETAFLTKTGDVGMVLSISGVDYGSLDRSEQEYAVNDQWAIFEDLFPNQNWGEAKT
jgi:type IV secretion system protein VirB4